MRQAIETDETIQKKFKGASVVFIVDDDTESDLRVTTSLSVLQDLLQKKLTPQQAFMKGNLKIKGNMALAMKLTVLLAATRKYLPGASKL